MHRNAQRHASIHAYTQSERAGTRVCSRVYVHVHVVRIMFLAVERIQHLFIWKKYFKIHTY